MLDRLDNLKRLLEIPDDGGEWMPTQRRLIEAGFRTNDKMTLETAYNNMVGRLGKEFADNVLFEEYVAHQQNNLPNKG